MACDCGKGGNKPVTPMGKWNGTFSPVQKLAATIKKSGKTTKVTVGKRK